VGSGVVTRVGERRGMEFEVGPVGRGRDEHSKGGFGCAVDLPGEGSQAVLDYPVPGGEAQRTYSYDLISMKGWETGCGEETYH